MKPSRSLFACLFASAALLPAAAQVPQLISYQGRVVSNATNYHGSGRFKFSLVDGGSGQTFWSNDGSGIGGAEPASAVTATVNQGLVALFLGDATLGMQPISSAIFATNPDVRLRIRFGDGANPFQPLSPDQRIVSVGYAMLAASVMEGSISDRHLSPNAAISANKIGGGDLMATRLKVGVSNVLSGGMSTIAGGSNNAATGDAGVIGGGQNNRVTDNFGVVSGGANNQAGNGDGTLNNAPYATVGGGQQNAASEDYATVAGGWTNTASGFATAIGGGRENTASGSYATVPGGQRNRAAGNNSFAAGTRAQALHRGTIVLSDSMDDDFTSVTNDSVLVRAANGVGINTNSPAATLDVNGSGRFNSLEVAGHLINNGLLVAELVPVGSVLSFYGDPATLPAHWKLCDGSAVSDPLSPFNGQFLPDLRERFLRGAGSSSPLGLQGGNDSIPDHHHYHDHHHSFSTDDNIFEYNYFSTVSVSGGGSSFILGSSSSLGGLAHSHSGTTGLTDDPGSYTGYANGSGTRNSIPGPSIDNRPRFFSLHFIIRIR